MDDADELYGLPLDRFVPERTALAKSLRAADERDEAASVARLRKPSVDAWAVNQLVRTQRRAFDELLAAGDALRDAHEAALSGSGDGQALRDAGERERVAVEQLVSAARGLLSAEGHELSPTMLERVGETLRAAARDQNAREQVQAGRLERELQWRGFGVSEDVKPGRKSGSRPKRPSAGAEKRAAADREKVAARKAAQVVETQARRVAERASRAVASAQERRDRAAVALAKAEESLAQARTEGAAAEDLHRRAKAELEAI